MGFVKVLSDKLNKATETTIAILLAIMSIIIFLQVIYRYVIGSSIPWSEELARYILVYLTFLGTSIGVKKKSHIGVEIIVSFLPKPLAKAAEWIANGLSAIFFIVLIVYGSQITKVTMMQLSPAIHVKMGLIYMAIVISAVLMLLHMLANTVNTGEVEGK